MKRNRNVPIFKARGLTIGFIGAGTMGQALLKALRNRGVSPSRLMAADSSARTRRIVSRRFGIRVSADNREVARRSDVLILAVKPQQLPEVLPATAPLLKRRSLVLSIAAGVRLGWLEKRLPGVPIVRVMPNLPAVVGLGFSAMAAGRWARNSHRKLAHSLLCSVGEVVELPERHFDAITAVSGSGPAYLFFLVQAWEEASRSLGLPASVSSLAIRRTIEGSVRLLQASNQDAAELVRKVASKGGTTEAALKTLAKRRVAAHFAEALRSAALRSRELSLA